MKTLRLCATLKLGKRWSILKSGHPKHHLALVGLSQKQFLTRSTQPLSIEIA